MAAVSIQTLQLVSSNVYIAVVIDSKADIESSPGLDLIESLADERIVVDEKYLDVIASSRYIKLRLRNIVPGDFVYLDCDALPIGRLGEIW
ncbi:MAG: hypothetical protein ABW148_11185 [Sedimenticola sp.]